MTHVDGGVRFLGCQVTICRAVKFRRWRSLAAALSGVVGSELLGGDYQHSGLASASAGLSDVGSVVW